MTQLQVVDDTLTKELKSSLRRLYYQWKGQDILLAIEDAIEFKYGGKAVKPWIHKKFKLTATAWEFLIKIPPGYAYKDFKGLETIFSDATGGAVQISKHGREIKMCVSTEMLKKFYPYNFNPEDHLDKFLPIHCGYTAIGELIKDLASMVNVLCAGHPGSGKSTWIHSICMNLIHNNAVNPRGKINIIIIDLKKMEFQYLSQHALVITNKEDVTRVLQAVNKRMDQKIEIISKARQVNIQNYIKKGGQMEFDLVIVDELTELADNEEAQILLNRNARLGRAPGCFLIFSTQRPSAQTFKCFTETRAQFQANMCFHVRDQVNSQIVLDNELGSLIPNYPGRAIFQWDTQLETQAMMLPTEDIDRMEEMLYAISPPIVQNIPFYKSFRNTTTSKLPVV